MPQKNVFSYQAQREDNLHVKAQLVQQQLAGTNTLSSHPENSWQLPPFSSVRRNGGVLNKLSYALRRALLHTPSASPPRAGIPVAFDQCREFLCVCKPSCIMVVLMTTLFIKIAVLPLGTHQIMQTALQPMSFLLHQTLSPGKRLQKLLSQAKHICSNERC